MKSSASEQGLIGVIIDNRLNVEAHIADICHKVGEEVNALNRLKKILVRKTKKSL